MAPGGKNTFGNRFGKFTKTESKEANEQRVQYIIKHKPISDIFIEQ